MLREPSLRHLLTVSEDEARDALAELPQPIVDDLLTLHEVYITPRLEAQALIPENPRRRAPWPETRTLTLDHGPAGLAC